MQTTKTQSHFRLVFGGALSLVLTMGLARFTYTNALPAMQNAFGFGADTGGWLAAINYAGYLSGALLATRIADLQVRLWLFRILIIGAVLCNALMPLFDSVTAWSVLRYLSGLTTAGGMVIGTSLVIQVLRLGGRPALIGVHFGGVGLGITLVALVLGGEFITLDWKQIWYLSALMGLVALPFALAGVNVPPVQPGAAAVSGDDIFERRAFGFLLISYFFSGTTYSIGTTFIVAAFESDPVLNGSASLAWLLVGLAAAPSAYLWVRIAAALGTSRTLIIAGLIQTLGCLLPVLLPGTWPALIGSVLFGSTFMGIVAVVLALGGHLSRHNPAKLMGLLVVAYGLGQITGPLGAGLWMEHSGNPLSAMWIAGLLSAISVMLLLPARFKE
ncbi:YbfB/YjiJ family MFS transporter [Granulosicoccaceae sp. 1_MG-2023]|nr:YbfB/YjiJ family MFS transporter [Granulosicoccaceae sp. 1_MG-2023]